VHRYGIKGIADRPVAGADSLSILLSGFRIAIEIRRLLWKTFSGPSLKTIAKPYNAFIRRAKYKFFIREFFAKCEEVSLSEKTESKDFLNS
jgi:hypothetical protein